MCPSCYNQGHVCLEVITILTSIQEKIVKLPSVDMHRLCSFASSFIYLWYTAVTGWFLLLRISKYTIIELSKPLLMGSCVVPHF